MYDEAADFAQHIADVTACEEALQRAGIPPVADDIRLLDIGGGGGVHAGLLAVRGAAVTCVDIENQHERYGGEFLKLLREKFARHSHELPLARFEFCAGDAQHLPWRDGWFDWVTSFNAFEHIPDPARALAEVARVLKPGGIAYVSFDPIWTADTGSHFAHYVPEPWAHLLLGDDEFRDRMRAAGASDQEIAEYPAAMNRRRLAEYERMISSELPATLEVLLVEGWSGYVDPSHLQHPNHAQCLDHGFGESELAQRGMRWVFRRRAAVRRSVPSWLSRGKF